MDDSSELRSWHCTVCCNSIADLPIPAGESTRTSLELSPAGVVADVMEVDSPLSGDEVSPGSPAPSIDDIPYILPDAVEEESMEDAVVDSDLSDHEGQTEYMVIESSTQRGRPKAQRMLWCYSLEVSSES